MDILKKIPEPHSKIPESETDYILCLSLDIGEAMMRNGAEVHRVEDTMDRLCRAYGAVHTEIFAIPTAIFAAIRMEDGSYSSQMRTIDHTAYDLFKVERFNGISRKACKERPPLGELDEMIKEAKRKKSYPYALIVLGAAIATGSFAFFFGGNYKDAIVAAVIGAIICIGEKIPMTRVNGFAKIVMQSFVGGALAMTAVWLGIGVNADKIIMGTIMYSIPGLALGVAARDMLYGDFLAGTLKLIHTVLVALMIALGYVLAMLVFGAIGGGVV